MYYWNIFLMVTFLAVNLQYSESRRRVLNLDCSQPKRKYDITLINLKENEDCFPPGWVYCKVKPSRELTGLRMKGTLSPQAIFPVDTWKDRELEIFFDNSDVIISPNASVYPYLLPRAFETVPGDSVVDVECDIATGPVPTGYPVYTDISPTETVPGSLSTLHVVFITLAVLLVLALITGLAIFLIRRHWPRGLKSPTKTRRVKNKGFALTERSISTENKYWTKGDLGAAVYVDPAAANNYDNKDQVSRDTEKPTSGEYSYSYMQTKPKVKVHGSRKEPEQNSQKYSYAYIESTPKAKKNGTGGKPGKNSQKYSYAYMDTASARADPGHGKEPEVNRQISEIPYEDVEGGTYSYTYSAVSKPNCKNT